MTNHPNQPFFLADEGVGLDANRAIHSPHYLSMQTQCQQKSGAKDYAFSWYKPRYGSLVSRGNSVEYVIHTPREAVRSVAKKMYADWPFCSGKRRAES
jgi:hypothetical protein